MSSYPRRHPSHVPSPRDRIRAQVAQLQKEKASGQAFDPSNDPVIQFQRQGSTALNSGRSPISFHNDQYGFNDNSTPSPKDRIKAQVAKLEKERASNLRLERDLYMNYQRQEARAISARAPISSTAPPNRSAVESLAGSMLSLNLSKEQSPVDQSNPITSLPMSNNLPICPTCHQLVLNGTKVPPEAYKNHYQFTSQPASSHATTAVTYPPQPNIMALNSKQKHSMASSFVESTQQCLQKDKEQSDQVSIKAHINQPPRHVQAYSQQKQSKPKQFSWDFDDLPNATSKLGSHRK